MTWKPNFPQVQTGRVTIRYGLLTLSALDMDALHEHSSRIRNPVLTWPVTTNGRVPSAGSL